MLHLKSDVSVSLKALGDGLNFLSDAFFAEISHDEGVTYLFVKVSSFLT